MEFMQYLFTVGAGPSLNTCPRCAAVTSSAAAAAGGGSAAASSSEAAE